MLGTTNTYLPGIRIFSSNHYFTVRVAEKFLSLSKTKERLDKQNYVQGGGTEKTTRVKFCLLNNKICKFEEKKKKKTPPTATQLGRYSA